MKLKRFVTLILILTMMSYQLNAADQNISNLIIGIEDLRNATTDSDGGNDINFVLQGKAVTQVANSLESAQEYHLSLKPLLGGATLANELLIKNLCTSDGITPEQAYVQIFRGNTTCEQDFNTSAIIVDGNQEIKIFENFNIDGFKNCNHKEFINMYPSKTCEGLNVSIHIKCANNGRMNFPHEKIETLFLAKNQVSGTVDNTSQTQGIPNFYVYDENAPIPNEKTNFFTEILGENLNFLESIQIENRPEKIQERYTELKQNNVFNNIQTIQERGVNKSITIIGASFDNSLNIDTERSGTGYYFNSPFYNTQAACEESYNQENLTIWSPDSSSGTSYFSISNVYPNNNTSIFKVDNFSTNRNAYITIGGTDQVDAINGLNFNLNNEEVNKNLMTYACVFRPQNQLCPENFAFIPADPVVGSNAFCMQKTPITEDSFDFTNCSESTLGNGDEYVECDGKFFRIYDFLGSASQAKQITIHNNFSSFRDKCMNTTHPKGGALGVYGLLSLKEYKALYRNIETSNYGTLSYYGARPTSGPNSTVELFVNTNSEVNTSDRIDCENNSNCTKINNPFTSWINLFATIYIRRAYSNLILDYKGEPLPTSPTTQEQEANTLSAYYNVDSEPTCGRLERDGSGAPISGAYAEGEYQFAKASASNTVSLCENRDNTIFIPESGSLVKISCSSDDDQDKFDTYSHLAYYISNQDNSENDCPLVIPSKRLYADVCLQTIDSQQRVCYSPSQFKSKPTDYPTPPGSSSFYTEANPVNK